MKAYACLTFLYLLSAGAYSPAQERDPQKYESNSHTSGASEEVAVRTTHQDSVPVDETAEYLENLRSFATEYLESSPGDVIIGEQTERRGGPIDRQTYFQSDVWEDAASLNGTIEPDSIQSIQAIVQKVIIRDREAIQYLFDACPFYTRDVNEIEFMEIFDFSRDGFNNGDLISAHPVGETYILDALSEEFVDAAATWTQRENLQRDTRDIVTDYMPQLIAELGPPTQYEWEIPEPDLSRDENERMAIRAIGAGVHHAVTEQYGNSPLALYFARTDSITKIEMWGYEPDSLRFNYLFTGKGQVRNDLFTIASRDSFIKTYRSYVDVMVIKEERCDTLFTPKANR